MCDGAAARLCTLQRLSLSTCGIMSNGAMYMLGGVPITHIDMKSAVTLSSSTITTDVSTITHTARVAARTNPVLTAAVAVTLRSRNPLVGYAKVAFDGDSASPKPKSPTHVSSIVTTASDAAEIFDRSERAKAILRSLDVADPEHTGIQFNPIVDPFDPQIIEDMPDYHKRHRKPVAVPNLVSLDISLCSDVTDVGLEYLTSRCTKLQVRWRRRVSCALIAARNGARAHFPARAQELNLSSLFRLSNSQILATAQRCNGLQALNISHISGVNDNLIENLATTLWIEELDISYCAQVTDGACHPLHAALACVGIARASSGEQLTRARAICSGAACGGAQVPGLANFEAAVVPPDFFCWSVRGVAAGAKY